MKHILNQFLLLVFFSLATILPSCASCFRNSRVKPQFECLLKDKLGDSISNIISRSRHLEIYNDSNSVRIVSKKDIAVLEYIIADSCNYETDSKVFSEFKPQLSIKCKRFKKHITIQYDFEMCKWRILGKNDNLLCMYDLRSMEIIRFVLMALPNDNNIHEYLTNK